ncbi:GNAT family N-acetyltransferase [Chromohalobacter moromii]|uniref:GNAT family N-acetyltransferase n=1 Tax=Chromohalobacter moromii TaxID=2860329 RepID=A0A9X2X4Q2_9GAMM|nr:GNAT family N-acetyltransferase [Chromohalobacter moromii]MCK2046621.1 GNAT family N-acetyltransferase [Chromohalobacter moromii]MCT8506197.1 GNAT family N-acetyltransferase [Chromohalobacter moromii]
MFRHAQSRDLARIVEIYNQSIPGRLATADLVPVTVEARQAWFDAHDEAHPLWVLEVDEKIVGWASLQPFYGRAAYAATNEASLYVAREHQGCGYGKQLVERLIDSAMALGRQTLLGFIFAHNAPSLALFQRCGFERWGLLPEVADLDGQPTSLAILGRRLTPRHEY